MDTLIDMNASFDNPHPCQAVRVLGPEDLRPGQYVTPHHQAGQLIWMTDGCDAALGNPKAGVLRVSFIPRLAGRPMKVRKVCLPYVLVKTPKGKVHTIDTRLCQLVELSRDYGKAAFKAMRPPKDKANPGQATSG